MKPWRTRHRWWLLIACLAAGIGAIGWWQLSGRRLTREQYDRIRLGMTPAQVAAVMGGPPIADPVHYDDRPGWEIDSMERNASPLALIVCSTFHRDTWLDALASIWVVYKDGKVCDKQMHIYQPRKATAAEWLNWLCRHVELSDQMKHSAKLSDRQIRNLWAWAIPAGIISLWAMFVIMAVMGLSFTATGRIRVTKTSALSGWVASTLGMVIFLIGLLMAVATWPPFLIHSVPWR